MDTATDKQNFVDEIVDIEIFTAEGRKVPDYCKGYLIRINEQKHIVEESAVTREEVVRIAKFDSVENACVRVYIHGSRPRVLQPGEEVDLTLPGVEHFQVDKECIVKVKVNATTFELAVPTTGKEIKQAAIEAGAKVGLDFSLFLELKDGPPDQIDDDELVFVDEGACFVALAGDDNS